MTSSVMRFRRQDTNISPLSVVCPLSELGANGGMPNKLKGLSGAIVPEYWCDDATQKMRLTAYANLAIGYWPDL